MTLTSRCSGLRDHATGPHHVRERTQASSRVSALDRVRRLGDALGGDAGGVRSSTMRRPRTGRAGRPPARRPVMPPTATGPGMTITWSAP